MPPPKILLCLDTDPQPSVFDGIVAIDAGVDHLLRHGGIQAASVRDLVYGAMFTRGPDDLKNSAVFIGGSDVSAGELLLEAVRNCFFGPVRVSVMLDSNGANTTAAAAVLAAGSHVALQGASATVLAATGSVGRRVVRLLAHEGANVRAASRALERAQDVCDQVAGVVDDAKLEACQVEDQKSLLRALDGAQIVIAAGAPGVELLPTDLRKNCKSLKVAVDLNAVPPPGIGGVDARDKATPRDSQVCYGAVGVGGSKMKIHKAAVTRLFSANDLVLDAEEIYELAKQL